MSVMTDEQAVAELVQRHRDLYDGPAIDTKLEAIIRDGSHTEAHAVGISCGSCGPPGRSSSTPMWKWCQAITRRPICDSSPSPVFQS